VEFGKRWRVDSFARAWRSGRIRNVRYSLRGTTGVRAVGTDPDLAPVVTIVADSFARHVRHSGVLRREMRNHEGN
jgi:hypothetical protein